MHIAILVKCPIISVKNGNIHIGGTEGDRKTTKQQQKSTTVSLHLNYKLKETILHINANIVMIWNIFFFKLLSIIGFQ